MRRTYTFPVICRLPMQEIDTALVTKALEPIWMSKTETASRCEDGSRRLDWAAVRGFPPGRKP